MSNLKSGVLCHAEGDRCLGCDHYYGRAPVCSFATPAKQQGTPTPRTVDEKIAAALVMVSDLCQRRRAWTMSVPARPDYDPDLVISGALIAAERELSRSREDCERLREDLRKSSAVVVSFMAAVDEVREYIDSTMDQGDSGDILRPLDAVMDVAKALAATRKEEGNG